MIRKAAKTLSLSALQPLRPSAPRLQSTFQRLNSSASRPLSFSVPQHTNFAAHQCLRPQTSLSFSTCTAWRGFHLTSVLLTSDSDAQLTPEQVRVLRHKGTEFPGSSEFEKFYPKEGVFECVGCGTPLYEAKAKFGVHPTWPACSMDLNPHANPAPLGPRESPCFLTTSSLSCSIAPPLSPPAGLACSPFTLCPAAYRLVHFLSPMSPSHHSPAGIAAVHPHAVKRYFQVLTLPKPDSGCGWPAFYEGLNNAVKEETDPDGRRTEILCNSCGGHLGHVFKGEGFPTPTDERHCVNGVILNYKKG